MSLNVLLVIILTSVKEYILFICDMMILGVYQVTKTCRSKYCYTMYGCVCKEIGHIPVAMNII